MTTRSIVLFVHILGVLTLFVALAQEWLTLKLFRASDGARPLAVAIAVLAGLPRLTGIAVALILASGMYLAAQSAAFRSGWVGVSFVAMVLVGTLGGIALRPVARAVKADDGSGVRAAEVRRLLEGPFLRASLHLRVSVALAIVYLMIAKIGFVEAVIVVVFAIGLGSLSAVAAGRARTAGQQHDDRATAAGLMGRAR